jgi:hypothetical protein
MNIPTSKKEFLDSLINGTEKFRKEIVDFFAANKENENVAPQQNISQKDSSIIDVTNEYYKIPQSSSAGKFETHTVKVKVPYWRNQYVYSYSEINYATREQKEFYSFLKRQFLNKLFVDLEGNSNYAFILLFDLLNEYEKHQNISKLEGQVQLLSEFYPKTRSYGLGFLIERFQDKGDVEGVARFREERQYGYDYDNYWNFGNKYKTKLNLKNDDVKLLNRLYYSSNNFCNIEFCCLEVIKLYILTIELLHGKLFTERTNLDEQINILADLIARKQFRYRLNSQNYTHSLETSANEIYTIIFKQCENAVREYYAHKRKLNADVFFTNSEVKNEFEIRIGNFVREIIAGLILQIALPDEETEIQLNAQTQNRWKIKFSKLTEGYDNDAKRFIEEILQLGNLNKKNPSVENIFFEASKFIAKFDKEASLTLYVYYLYHDLKSATFDNKKFTKNIEKNLFKTDEHRREFETLINELISNGNLEKALRGISEIYAVKRKKIQLNSASIKEVQEQHSGTVKLLNSVLNDEYESLNDFLMPDLELLVSFLQNNAEESTANVKAETAEIPAVAVNKSVSDSKFKDEIAFTLFHRAALEFFYRNNLSVSHGELEAFAKSNSAFKNQLIDGLNEVCYEVLDDVLIEEDEENFTIYEDYYHKLLAK